MQGLKTSLKDVLVQRVGAVINTVLDAPIELQGIVTVGNRQRVMR